jgi:hypothetical protein
MARHAVRSLRSYAFVALAIAAFASASGRAQTALTSTSIPQFVYDATWPKQPLPKGWIIGNVIGVAIDARDHVWILHRPATITEQERGAGFGLKTADCCFPAPPVIEFDPAGNLVQAWGGPGPGYKWVDSEHGLFVDHKDNVWVGNNQGPHLLKFTRDGKYLLTIGTPGAKPPASNDPAILGGPAPWVHPRTNELFVADGYVNRRVIVFDADTGQYKRMWGAYGGKPDDSVPWKFNPEGTDKPPSRQFQTVTGVAVSRDDLVYVADRSNNRIQVFRLDGTFVREGFILAKTPRGRHAGVFVRQGSAVSLRCGSARYARVDPAAIGSAAPWLARIRRTLRRCIQLARVSRDRLEWQPVRRRGSGRQARPEVCLQGDDPLTAAWLSFAKTTALLFGGHLDCIEGWSPDDPDPTLAPSFAGLRTLALNNLKESLNADDLARRERLSGLVVTPVIRGSGTCCDLEMLSNSPVVCIYNAKPASASRLPHLMNA